MAAGFFFGGLLFPGSLIAYLAISTEFNFRANFDVGPGGFHGTYTDSGDEWRIDLPADRIIDVRVERSKDYEGYSMVVQTRDKRYGLVTTGAGILSQSQRTHAQLEILAFEARRALGLTKKNQTRFGANPIHHHS